MPREDYSVWAIPFSHIFRERVICDGGKISGSTLCLRSQDVFRHSFKAMIPGTKRATIQGISICTSSWKKPSSCELDAPDAPTRILISITAGTSAPFSVDRMVVELLLIPTSAIPSNKPSQSSITNDAPENGYLLMCRGPSVTHTQSSGTLMSPTRTGYLVADAYNTEANANIINMLDLLEERFSDKPNNSNQMEHFLGKTWKSSDIHHFINADGRRPRIRVEPYSGAIWYHSGTKLFMYCTD